ncbi:flagellar brake domain-containing protein [Clostridium sp. CS001]|uniref:flagellar brake protein n=1 Tax=Clostridium sp. CS001 TaxID=2880648 RepID=UPI001CF4B0F9|nr:flagellar brake domain-containing protein [Clostridium sp. CS001]MCB2288890.1 flagellar brake domain-containing protein [Clostridium sp. CS001]
MTKVDFKVNMKLELFIDEKYFNCNIQDITDEYIATNIPVSTGQYIPLSRGTAVEVIYYEEDSIYKFKSSVIGRKFENIPILLLAQPTEIEKIQRRKYFRITLLNSVKYKNLKNEPKTNPKTIEDSEYTNGVLLDLSGGGMKIKVAEHVKQNDFLLVSLTINNENLLVVGQAMRIIKDDEGRFVCGLSFEFLDNSTREVIIKFIFQLMREQMKKS